MKFLDFENDEGKRIRLKVAGERNTLEINALKFAQSFKSGETRIVKVEKDGTEINEIIIIRA
jgi:hypothetical protein